MKCKCDYHEQLPLSHHICPRLIEVLDRIREKLGRPVIVYSGYRCPSHNAEVGGVPNSYHTQGIAADINVLDHEDVDYVADIARQCGADGVGRYYSQRFVHVDTRGYEANWSEW